MLVKFKDKIYLQYHHYMHKSLTKKGEASGLPTDRTKAKSTDKEVKGLSYIR